MARALVSDDPTNPSGHRPGSPAHRARVRTWQALCALLPFLTAQRARRAFDQTWQCIEVSGIEHRYSVRTRTWQVHCAF